MRTLYREELAWAAGFFDGEGHVGVTRYNGSGRYTRDRVMSKLRLTINQADPQVLERFQAAVGGIGYQYGPKTYKSGTAAWYYSSSCFEVVQAIIAALWQWLSPVKREQARNALLAMREYHANPVPHPFRWRRVA